jgi:hypothetical protein
MFLPFVYGCLGLNPYQKQALGKVTEKLARVWNSVSIQVSGRSVATPITPGANATALAAYNWLR